jgi:hypothetical protein
MLAANSGGTSCWATAIPATTAIPTATIRRTGFMAAPFGVELLVNLSNMTALVVSVKQQVKGVPLELAPVSVARPDVQK